MAKPTRKKQTARAISGPEVPGTLDAPAPVRRSREDQENTASSEVERFMRKVRNHMKEASEAEFRNRQEADEDDEFRDANQWPADIASDRENAGKPCLTINRIPTAIRLITNPQRVARIAPKATPMGTTSVEDANIVEGIVRGIQNRSHADVARETAFDSAVTGGWSYYRILVKFLQDFDITNPEEAASAFDQDIFIERITNRNTVYFDPACKDFLMRDARYAFIVEDMPREAYEERYGVDDDDTAVGGVTTFPELGKLEEQWFGSNTVRVAEYFYEKWEEIDIYQLKSGQVMTAKNLAKSLGREVTRSDYAATRKWAVRKVYWAKVNGKGIIQGNKSKTEGRLIMGKYIPIVPVIGEETFVKGNRRLRGVVRDSKDPQRMYNYWSSSATEAIAMAPKSPWIAAAGQIEKFKEIWETANVKNYSVLPYDPVSIDGTLAPAPARNVAEPAIQAIVAALHMADQDFKLTTQFFDPSLGQNKSDQSGTAIRQLQTQGAMGNAHYVDNYKRALNLEGEILLDLIPRVYTRAGRVVTLMNAQDQQEQIVVGKADPKNPKGKNGQPRAIDLKKIKTNITVTVDTAYTTKRQEAVSSILDLVKAVPAVGAASADVLVENMDWPGAQKISERLQKLLPPQLQPQVDQADIPPQIMAKMGAAQKMIEALTGEVNKLVSEKQSKSLELASKEYIAGLQVQAQLVTAMTKVSSAESIAAMKEEYARIENMLNLQHDRISSEMADIRQTTAAQMQPAADAAGGAPTSGATSGPTAPAQGQ